MKWFLVKTGCIIGAGVIAAVLWGDILAGVLIAPFGWIAGKTAQVWSEARGVALPMVNRRRQHEHSLVHERISNVLTDPRCSGIPGNIFTPRFFTSDEDW